MTAFTGRMIRSLRWRWGEVQRHTRDVAGALGHAVQRLTGGVLVTQGGLDPSDRMAVYMIFPTDGLQPSHHLALRALAEKGYTPLVVSNLPLSEAERAALVPLVWRIVERPNFGYDFGAYREGIRHLAPLLPQLERLVLLNDSVWFPLPDASDWLTRAEALGVDLAGAVSNCGIATPNGTTLDGFRWNYNPGLPDFHYCSFALSLGQAALQAPSFARFWRQIRLTDNKFHTVRRGEVGLSQALIAAGLSHGETLDVRGLGAQIEALDLARLRQFVADLVIPEDTRLEAMRQRLLAEPDGPGRHGRLLEAALGIVALTGPAYALPAYAYDTLGHPFLKKSPLRLGRAGAETTLRLTERLPGDAGAMIHAEARALAAQRQEQARNTL